MKIKSGFTTNSSSSSFVILSKNPLREKKDFEKLFKDIMGENKLFSNLFKDVAGAFHSSAQEMTLKEYLDDRCYEDVTEAPDVVSENISEYPFLYDGSFGNDGEWIEAFLCEAQMNYKDENTIIDKDGGY